MVRTVKIVGIDMDVSEQHSNRDYTGRRFAEPLTGVIYGSCFSQDEPGTAVFPPGMAGVTFAHCNLDNVLVPPGNVTINCSTRKIKVQNDGYDWELGADLKPIKITNEADRIKSGDNTDPSKIPTEKVPK